MISEKEMREEMLANIVRRERSNYYGQIRVDEFAWDTWPPDRVDYYTDRYEEERRNRDERLMRGKLVRGDWTEYVWRGLCRHYDMDEKTDMIEHDPPTNDISYLHVLVDHLIRDEGREKYIGQKGKLVKGDYTGYVWGGLCVAFGMDEDAVDMIEYDPSMYDVGLLVDHLIRAEEYWGDLWVPYDEFRRIVFYDESE